MRRKLQYAPISPSLSHKSHSLEYTPTCNMLVKLRKYLEPPTLSPTNAKPSISLRLERIRHS